ncbi:MAG TPA: DUF86 domain-containing protein [Cyclobacteriaceae bacterium]|nr:DUF86 domain-containing protein [Cyclobacteriaceae bacterium]
MTNSAILIRHILAAIERIETYTKDLSEEECMKNFLIQDGVIRNLEIIGEASAKINSLIRERNPAIPWKKISGMRNKLIHEYFGVDLSTVWVVIVEDIASLKPDPVEILNDLKE